VSRGGHKAGGSAGRHLQWLRIWGLSSLEKKRLRGNLITLYSFLRSGIREGGARVFSLAASDRMHGNGSKLH